MHGSKRRNKRAWVVHALTLAIAGAVLAPALERSVWGLRIKVPLPVPPGGGAVPPAPRPDPGNTGRPEDPGAPPSRDPGGLMESGSQVYVDDSFASVEKLRTAIRQANQGQSQLAIGTFQDIVDEFGQKLVYLNDGSYVSITDFVRERLLAMPAIRNGMYDQLFGAQARKEIDAAIDQRDISELIRACDRYFPSTAALGGLGQAAEWYFERGDFSAAARTWRGLLSHPLVGDRQPELLFRTAVAESLAGSGERSLALRGQLEKDFPEVSAPVTGRNVNLLAKLDEILAMPAWEKVNLGGDEWPAFGGGPSRAGAMKSSAAIGARLWSLTMGETASTVAGAGGLRNVNQQLVRVGVSPEQFDSGTLASHPVLSNGMLFVHTGDQIVAASANAGSRLWSFPINTPGMAQAMANLLRNYGVNPRISAHESVVVYGDQVFAVLPVLPASGQVRTNNNGVPMIPTRLVCLSRDDGREIWSRSAEDVRAERDNAFSFSGSPIVTRQGVYVMARKLGDTSFTQQYLVRLDRQTGAVTWVCYLCSMSNMAATYGGVAAMLSNVAVPTLVDDVVYIATGQGADCAVDANVGRILWLRVTAEAGQARQQGATAVPLLPSWKFNPPVISGDRMITSDAGQGLRVYDRWTGKQLRAISATDLQSLLRLPVGFKVDVLAGVAGSRLIFSGGNVSVSLDVGSLEKEKFDPHWIAEIAGAGKATGRPFLSESGYYVPFERKLVRIDLATGKAEDWAWPLNDKEEPGRPGNILVTSEQVVVVNDLEVVGYSKWETARDNWLRKIAQQPEDPDHHLGLAEVSFRTNHHDLSRQHMKQSVDLAVTGKFSPGKSAAETLSRLYRTSFQFAEQLLQKNDNVLRDQSRFFYEQCRAVAREPEQQAEWRLRLAELALMQKKSEEAVELYSQVLADPALRTAGYRENDVLASAGATAEQRIRAQMQAVGPAVYQRFEERAVALVRQASSSRDPAALQQVIDSYPNSRASIEAARTLVSIFQDKSDWDSTRRVLWWLQPRVVGDAQAEARSIADLAMASLGLKKYASAAAWASRGARQYKDFAWTDLSGRTTTFAELRARIDELGGVAIEGRPPAWRLATGGQPQLGGAPLSGDNELLANGQLLVPVETHPALREPGLMFIRSLSRLRIYSMADGAFSQDVNLPRDAETVLLGVSEDTAVLLQSNMLIGVDLKSRKTWTRALRGPAPVAGVSLRPNAGIRRIVINGEGGAMIVGGNVIINGNQVVGDIDSVILIDETGRQILPGSGGDPEMVRRAAFAPLGQQAGFTTARLQNGRVVVLLGNQLESFDIHTGSPAWVDASGNSVPAKLPEGIAAVFVGNEDLLVAQVDGPDGRSSIFCAVDADTGKVLRQVKLENERATWRALGDDGTLFVITDRSVSAYDLASGNTGPAWRRNDIQTRYSGASALTLDGLMVVNDNSDVMCLALESGESRWPPMRLQMSNELGTLPALRSMVDGDTVVFQSGQAVEAYRTYPAGDRQLAWRGRLPAGTPPLQGLQLSEAYLVHLASGQVSGGGRSGVRLVFHDRKSGLLRGPVPAISRTGQETDAPPLRAWQVLDNAIAFEVPNGGNRSYGTIYLWKNVAP